MLYFDHDPAHLYFPHGMIRIARWLFLFAAQTPNAARCFCNPEWRDEQQYMAELDSLARQVQQLEKLQ